MNISAEQILESRLGAELSEQEAATLAELMDMRELGGGEFLITEGMTDDSLHVIVEGTLEVVKRTAGDTTASIAVIREGHHGWSARTF
jgi:CRP-like cAMP-binding protein